MSSSNLVRLGGGLANLVAGETGTPRDHAARTTLRLAERHTGRWHPLLGDGGVERSSDRGYDHHAQRGLRQGYKGSARRLVATRRTQGPS
jgi:hypothetical protein